MRILVVDDEAIIREGLGRVLEKEGWQADLKPSGHAALERMQQEEYDLVISDLKMPGMSGMELLKAIRILQPDVPVIIITGYSTVESAVEAIRSGAYDYLAKPFTPTQIVEMTRRALTERQQLLASSAAASGFEDGQGFAGLVGVSAPMQRIYRRIQQVAHTDSTVLITGESGTGKELVARAIQRLSPRRDQPFVALDCTSLAETLLESELFGHVKGSFTGATQSKVGLFKVADGGTLFLDEISNLTHHIQAKLLRVLQEREITPIGDTRPSPIDIRLIVASNRNLRTMVAHGDFREDLYFRLNIIPVELPPLRERDGDLPLLAGHFIRKFSQKTGKDVHGLSPGALALLQRYPFPGNVRELENLMERAVVLAGSGLIEPADLELYLPGEMPELEEGYVPRTTEELKELKREVRERAVQPLERAFVLEALRRNDWNVTHAAEAVGMLRPNFQALLKKQGISVRELRDASHLADDGADDQ